jgi:BASS family bile acid:Na+ symporter
MVFPSAAVIVCKTFTLHPAVITALVTLAIAPVSVLFPTAMLPLVAPGRATAYAQSFSRRWPSSSSLR